MNLAGILGLPVPQETETPQHLGRGPAAKAQVRWKTQIDYRPCLVNAKSRPLSASPARHQPSPRLHRPPALGHPARPLVNREHALSRVAQTLVEQINVIASLGQMRDERSPHVMEAKPFGLLRVAVADASPDAGEKMI